jgi:hypothetical protein
LRLPERAYLLFRVPVASVVELAVETACLQFSADAQGMSYSRAVDRAELLGFIEAVRASWQVRSPNLWWPDDRTWIVGTDIDGDDTLVAGSQAAVDAILAHTDLNAKRVTAHDQLTERT